MRNHGFTLIEALVALVLLATTFGVVWEWFGTASINTLRIERATTLSDVFDEFLHYMRLESLQNKRSGEYVISGYNVRWRATPIRESKKEAYRRQPKWEVVLFKVEVDIYEGTQLVKQVTTAHVDQWQNTDVSIESIFRR